MRQSGNRITTGRKRTPKAPTQTNRATKMSAAFQKPRIFISSTIYDFRDLRSALRYWLEELGYDVLTSEHNDFPANPDLNSYDSCIKAINESTHFILLIGGRVGGLYDKSSCISITQKEYLHAYDRLKSGGIKIISFVRQETWNLREDRKALQKFLEEQSLHKLELNDIKSIANHRSSFANDAEFTIGFINMIARPKEMKDAVAGNGPFPSGNWIYTFTEFSDIINTLRTELRLGTNLRKQSLITNLKSEITSNLQVLLTNLDTTTLPTYKYASKVRNSFSGKIDEESEFHGNDLKKLALFAISGCTLGRNLSTHALLETINSGEMLDFNPQTQAFATSPTQEALLTLHRTTDKLKNTEELFTDNEKISLFEEFRKLDNNRKYKIENARLIKINLIHDLQHNVAVMSAAIHASFDGHPINIQSLKLYGNSPLNGESEQIKLETPTPQQITQWINKVATSNFPETT